jgi:hypothetical protein
MNESKNTLKQIASMKPQKAPAPKELREIAIKGIGDWLIWIEIDRERSSKEFITEKFESDMLSIIKRQFTQLDDAQVAMSKLITKYSALQASERYTDFALSKIYLKINDLEIIEKIKNKGGRKPRKELYDIAEIECRNWYLHRHKKPSGPELSRMVENVMVVKKGSVRVDGNPYLSHRSARDFLKYWQVPIIKFNRQELIKSFAN